MRGRRSWFGLSIVAVGLVCALSGQAVYAQECVTNSDCDDGQACNGLEECILGPGEFLECVGGTPVVCNDGDPCTADSCVEPAGTCTNTPSGDSDLAVGPDGLCNTADDNIDLFGPNGACGGGDDVAGDGVCDLVDNCDLTWNPLQENADGDGAGDACDSAPCLVRSLYAFSGSSLYRVDPATGNAIFRVGGLANPTDIAVNAQETLAVVTGGVTDMAYFVNPLTGSIIDVFLPGGPSGVAYGPSSGDFYVALSASGELVRLSPSQGPDVYFPVTPSLTTPYGVVVNAAETTAYVSEETAGRISAVDLSSGAVSTIISTLQSPRALAIDPTGTQLYVIEAGSSELSMVQISDGVRVPIPATLVSPEGLALNAAGTVAYIIEWSLGSPGIVAVDLATGEVIPVTGEAGPNPDFFFNGGLDLSPRPPVVLTTPDFNSGQQSASVTLPVTVDDVSGLGVISADFTLDFNPAVLTATSVAAGSSTAACTVAGNLAMAGRVVVSVYCTQAISGQGSIAEITFNVTGSPGRGSPLDFVSVLLNEGSPAVCGDDGGFVVPVDISGRVVYYRSEAGTEPGTNRVDAATVTLERQDLNQDGSIDIVTVGTDASDCNGDYAFVSVVPPVRDYRVTPRKTGDFESAVDPFDAALNAQHVLGIATLTPNQRLAADVSGNGILTSFDSARIAQFVVGLIAQFQVGVMNGSDWAFVPAAQAEPNQQIQNPVPSASQQGRIRYAPITESAESQDFRGILYGDVSGNWTPACGALAPPPGADTARAGNTQVDATRVESTQAATSPTGVLALPSLRAAPGDVIRVPIRAEGTGSAIAFYLDVRYDPAVLRPLAAERGASAGAFNLTSNLAETGRARLALFNAMPLGADGEIVTLTFEVVGKPGSHSALALTNPTVNEGRIPVVLQEGMVLVRPRAARR